MPKHLIRHCFPLRPEKKFAHIRKRGALQGRLDSPGGRISERGLLPQPTALPYLKAKEAGDLAHSEAVELQQRRCYKQDPKRTMKQPTHNLPAILWLESQP